MEEVFLRFPHIGIKIFEKLDDSNLAKCREVSKSWKNFIDSEELPRKRIHRNWEKTLQDYPCKNSQTKLFVALVSKYDSKVNDKKWLTVFHKSKKC